MNRQEAIAKFGHAKFDAALCRFCQDGEESTHHVLTECDAFAATRQLLWGETYVSPPTNSSKKKSSIFLERPKLNALETF